MQADINLYRYCGDGPTDATDPGGLITWKLKKGECKLVMEARINFQFENPGRYVGRPESLTGRKWVEDRSYWTPEKKHDDMAVVKLAIQGVWNNSQFLIYPARRSYPMTETLTGRDRCRCPGPFKPYVNIIYGENLSNADFTIVVSANSLRAYVTPWPFNTTMYLSDDPSDYNFTQYNGFGQGPYYVPAHEFGHLLDITHPGHHFYKPWLTGADVEYAADPPALMGYGSEMRAEYFAKWTAELDKMYPKCGPWQAHQ
jgi:hypothetical protein